MNTVIYPKTNSNKSTENTQPDPAQNRLKQMTYANAKEILQSNYFEYRFDHPEIGYNEFLDLGYEADLLIANIDELNFKAEYC